MLDPILLQYHSTTLRLSDFELLNGNRWLNDTVIGFYYEYLEQKHKPAMAYASLLSPTVAHWLTYAAYDDVAGNDDLLHAFRTRDYIFVPVNDGNEETKLAGTHWSLLVYAKRENKFIYYDSLNQYNTVAAKHTMNRIIQCLDVSGAQFVVIRVPLQKHVTSRILQRVILSKDYSGIGLFAVLQDDSWFWTIESDDMPDTQQWRVDIKMLVRQLQLEGIAAQP
ncbi:SUMO1 sentrin specific peptidase 8 [Dimargaris verticillata]|uniref:SUMO1 sentrin specific peptidase 8 n=1 Tax=Dimargaris verticillata TaxID=2761393 RepID=A0A9W8B3G6_9FUNG|nr:SUMO1 sentrin specific peptidase 8 [Dimargaris verticillata]